MWKTGIRISDQDYTNAHCTIDQFRYTEILPNARDLSMRLWGINPTNSVVDPQSLILRSIVLS